MSACPRGREGRPAIAGDGRATKESQQDLSQADCGPVGACPQGEEYQDGLKVKVSELDPELGIRSEDQKVLESDIKELKEDG